MTKKEAPKSKNKDYSNLNDAITKAADNTGITKEQAYTFMMEFGEVVAGDKNSSPTDVDIILEKLRTMYLKYDKELKNIDTSKEESVGRHKFLSGKLQGIYEAIKIITTYND